MQRAQVFFIVDNCIIAALNISPPPRISRSSQFLSSKRSDSRKRASTWIFSAQKQISASCNISSLFCLKKQAVQMYLIFCLGHRQVVTLHSIAKLQFDHIFCNPLQLICFSVLSCNPRSKPVGKEADRGTATNNGHYFCEQLSQPSDLAQGKVYVSNRGGRKVILSSRNQKKKNRNQFIPREKVH